jgi:hypothetical protein
MVVDGSEMIGGTVRVNTMKNKFGKGDRMQREIGDGIKTGEI